MEKLNRVQVGIKILNELYEKYSYLEDSALAQLFYSFLVEKEDDLSSEVCKKYEIDADILDMCKQDLIIDIAAQSYGFLRYMRTQDQLRPGENEIIEDFDSLEFSLHNLVSYFRNPENSKKIHQILIDYFLYTTQEANFVEECRDYLYDETTDFYDKTIRLLRYIELADVLVMIHDEVMEKYNPDNLTDDDLLEMYALSHDMDSDGTLMELDADVEYDEEGYPIDDLEDEDYDDDEYDEYGDEYEDDEDPFQTKIQMYRFQLEQSELYERILNGIENYFDDKYDADDFIGFLMSYIYVFLIKEKFSHVMTCEDEEMLNILNRKTTTFDYAVEMFYRSATYVFNGIDLFAQEYYDNKGNIYGVRDDVIDNSIAEKIKLLDPMYEVPKPKTVDYEYAYIGNPLLVKIEQILADVKEKNPEDYMGELWEMLRDPYASEDFFESYGLDVNYVRLYQSMIIRFLARKYLEEACLRPVGDFSVDELFIFQGLMHTPSTNANMEKLFDMGYFYFIPNYYELKEKGVVHEKYLIRKLQAKGLLKKLGCIDATCLTDPIYRKTLQEGTLFSILEVNGPITTIKFLEHLWKVEPENAIEFLKEVLVSNYYYDLESSKVDAITITVKNALEGEQVEDFILALMNNKALLEELLKRYLEKETKTEYSLSYQEKLEQTPKIKQKLYPSDIQGKG